MINCLPTEDSLQCTLSDKLTIKDLAEINVPLCICIKAITLSFMKDVKIDSLVLSSLYILVSFLKKHVKVTLEGSANLHTFVKDQLQHALEQE